MTINLKKQNTKQKGSLLFEMLIVISLVAIILSVGTNAMFLSMRSSKASGERDVANTLASGALESTKAITEENWQNIYSLTKNTQHYYPSELEGKWVLVEGDETININNSSYARYIVINNVSRDGTTRNIESSYVSDNDDPSTQKVTVTVSWSDGSPVVISEYFFRWRNKICNQTEWTTAEPGNTVKDCPSATYDEKEDAIDVASGSLKLLASEAPTVTIGDAYQGGIVAYILQVGDPGYNANVQHGLIAASSDQSSIIWGCSGITISGADGTAIGTGSQNTTDILSGCATRPIAASIARTYTDGTYHDWYLPSKDELNKLYLNRILVGGFNTDFYYWSSSEYDSDLTIAWYQYFGNGEQSINGKYNATLVRAIRSF